ncbi:PHP domain-containing protein [Calidifontibacter sp. DB0510]|uniref:PHP domain-containing protein n=1 Tax=Metallococcus carri TaxID=1656884 RepID=A0A967B113_9MICO|nr:PHP domain-containing protein [Metallococcus carri]NHN55483.1 PHP domain-containing protein [Metallococcus carri]NOP38333.1 PHP domain-containing protein [Calidifontibacter sp. DB2511S]
MTSAAPPAEAPEPVDALRRIAFLLERARAGTYRVKAFRGAVETVIATPREELERRAQEGTLKQLPGIGSSTEAVIAACLNGEQPAYLIDLEAEHGGRLVEGGEAIQAALKGDCHSHSDWSDGGSPIQEMVATAMELGHDYLVLTDHSPRLKVANGLTAARLTQQLGVIDTINKHLGGQFTLLKGIEVDILDDGTLDQSEEMLRQLQVRVASVHSKLKMAKAPNTQRMLGAIAQPWTNILGHCTGRLIQGDRGTRAPSQFDAQAVFEACAEHDVAVEINARPERSDPPDDLLELARDIGCLFSIDSDAHAPGQLDLQQYGCARAEAAGIPPERIIDTWETERLIEWASAKIR